MTEMFCFYIGMLLVVITAMLFLGYWWGETSSEKLINEIKETIRKELNNG